MALQKILVLVGPTAVGKTELSLRLAEELQAEIISADSMQVYRGMDIGTAKPSTEERSRVTHQLLDVVEPDETFNVADYIKPGRKSAQGSSGKGRLHHFSLGEQGFT